MQTIKVIKDRMTQSFGQRKTRDHILYLCKNWKGEVIRVGATQNLNSRFNQYKNAGPRYGEWANDRIWEELDHVDYQLMNSRKELLREEDKMIKQYHPVYNTYQKV